MSDFPPDPNPDSAPAYPEIDPDSAPDEEPQTPPPPEEGDTGRPRDRG